MQGQKWNPGLLLKAGTFDHVSEDGLTIFGLPLRLVYDSPFFEDKFTASTTCSVQYRTSTKWLKPELT